MLGVERKQRQDDAKADEIDKHGDEKNGQRGFLHDDGTESNLPRPTADVEPGSSPEKLKPRQQVPRND